MTPLAPGMDVTAYAPPPIANSSATTDVTSENVKAPRNGSDISTLLAAQVPVPPGRGDQNRASADVHPVSRLQAPTLV